MMPMTEAQMRALARASAQQHGLDPTWFEAQLEQESGYKANAKSKAGAQGVAQFMPATAKEFGIDPSKPEQAIPAAARYMAQLKKRYNGNETDARIAYNWGMGNLDKFKAGKMKSIPAEAAEYNTLIAQRAGVEAPTQTAKAPKPKPKPKAGDDIAALQQATTELNQGLPPGALAPQPVAQAAPAAPQNDWLAQLQTLTSGAPAMAPQADGVDVLAQLQSRASEDQERVLANAFGETALPDIPGLDSVPTAVDRYLEKLLAG